MKIRSASIAASQRLVCALSKSRALNTRAVGSYLCKRRGFGGAAPPPLVQRRHLYSKEQASSPPGTRKSEYLWLARLGNLKRSRDWREAVSHRLTGVSALQGKLRYSKRLITSEITPLPSIMSSFLLYVVAVHSSLFWGEGAEYSGCSVVLSLVLISHDQRDVISHDQTDIIRFPSFPPPPPVIWLWWDELAQHVAWLERFNPIDILGI